MLYYEEKLGVPEFTGSSVTDVDEDGYGYVCAEYYGQVIAHFWAKDIPGKKIRYGSHAILLAKAREFEETLLTTFSPSHRALGRMFKAYLKWRELD